MASVYEIADEARQSIGKYCYEECNSFCCRKGYLVLTEEEMKLTVNDKKEMLESEGKLKKLEDGKYSLNFTNSLGGCPSLNSNMCKIHTNPKRSSTCKDFPIFIREDERAVHFSHRCPAVNAGLILAYSYAFRNIGYKIE